MPIKDKEKACLIPMRLQPLHKGHVEILKQLEVEFEKIYILLGSDTHPEEKNPFSFLERQQILFTHAGIERNKLVVLKGQNFKKNEDWVKYIAKLMDSHKISTFACSDKENYEKWFTKEPGVNVKKYKINTQVSATNVREKLDKICNLMLENPEFCNILYEGKAMLPNNSEKYAKKLIVLKLQERLEGKQ